MTRDTSLACPQCDTLIAVSLVALPLRDGASGQAIGAVLKQCPHCRAWSWMTLERQTAS